MQPLPVKGIPFLLFFLPSISLFDNLMPAFLLFLLFPPFSWVGEGAGDTAWWKITVLFTYFAYIYIFFLHIFCHQNKSKTRTNNACYGKSSL